jgi:hypothetical protein
MHSQPEGGGKRKFCQKVGTEPVPSDLISVTVLTELYQFLNSSEHSAALYVVPVQQLSI